MTRVTLAAAGILGAALLGLSGCSGPAIGQANQKLTDTPSATTPTSLPTPTPSVAASSQPESTEDWFAATPEEDSFFVAQKPVAITTVTVYKIDDQCNKFISEPAKVAADRPMEAAVGDVIDAQSSGDLKLSGYRVSVSRSGTATVDLRLAPDSRRKIVSLSTCEQLALFGSIRETLMKNPNWKVRSVRFTERGRRIVL